MLSAFKEVIRDFPLSEGKVRFCIRPIAKADSDTMLSQPFSRSFENALKPLIQFLVESRPISVSMANAINFVKSELPRQATESLPDSEAKKGLLSKIDHYIQERIIASDQLITTAAVEKIADNDVVLTYACSYVVEQILIEVRSLRLFRHLLCFEEEEEEEKKLQSSSISRVALVMVHCHEHSDEP
jgi:translation initiation factor eIF-2B subunit delta